MQQLTATFLPELNSTTPVKQITDALKKLPSHIIGNVPWSAYPYKPDVHFHIAYCSDAILLHYNIVEETIRAANKEPNSPVWEDSCVEMFISFGKGYYNFEINPLGTILAAFGPDRDNRRFLPPGRILEIKTSTGIIDEHGASPVNWNITIVIPFTLFEYDTITELKGSAATANFFKCGDKLPKPHFLSWSPINAPAPNFHLPEFFGKVMF